MARKNSFKEIVNNPDLPKAELPKAELPKVELSDEERAKQIMNDPLLSFDEKLKLIREIEETKKARSVSAFDKAMRDADLDVSSALDRHVNKLVQHLPPLGKTKDGEPITKTSRSLSFDRLVTHGGRIVRVQNVITFDVEPPKRRVDTDPVMRDRRWQYGLSKLNKERQELINKMWAEMGYVGPEKAD